MHDQPMTLDDFRSCEVSGCLIQVLEPEHRCASHGGHPKAAYLETSDGEPLLINGFPAPSGDCE